LEIIEQLAHVAGALAERRHDNLKDIQPIVQVLSERFRENVIEQETIRCGNYPNVDSSANTNAADALDLTGFEEPQEQPLHAEAHLADFVQENGSTLRMLEQAHTVAIGPGETASLMTEKLGLEETVRDCGAVDGDHRPSATPARRVNQSGGDFFPYSALSGDENLGISARGILDRLKKLGNCRTIPYDVARFGH
jgi:hypothetical protein